MNTLTPFLYPFSRSELYAAARYARKCLRVNHIRATARLSTASHAASTGTEPVVTPLSDRLNPSPDDYNITPFVDKCVLTIQAGNGGHGCASFLREKYIPDGPPNGGDGGTGGNIFVQAISNCRSLNQIIRKREYIAGRGQHGQGGNRGGRKGEDILLEVPVGTVIREIKRWDPVQIQIDLESQSKRSKDMSESVKEKMRDRWLYYPSVRPTDINFDALPPLPAAKHAPLAAMAPPSPIRLDLDQPMDKPVLLAAGALGGRGNPHFACRETPKPKVSTKGDIGMRVALALELKLVADVGLVGLPNAGKSTLLRAISNSRARIGNWAFTTLQPNIGTVVLDDYKGRPWLSGRLPVNSAGETITRFTIADIPGIIEDAHKDRGLGLDFLRHIERAQILAFVLDLSARDGVEALNALWREVGEYQTLKDRQELAFSQRFIEWNPFKEVVEDPFLGGVSPEEADALPPLFLPSITKKPWFVIATKADLPETQDNFLKLQDYVKKIETREVPHPSGRTEARTEGASVVPISGIRGEGIGQVTSVIVSMLK